MELPALNLKEVLALDTEGRNLYYADYSRERPDAVPCQRFAIRVGSKTLYSDDTYDLRVRFNRYLGIKRRGCHGV